MMQPSHGRNELRPIDFRQLKELVSVLDVLELYRWNPNRVYRGGAQLRGPCPIHGSTSAKSLIFAVNPERNAFKCFKCGAEGNQLDLAAHYFSLPKDQIVKIAVRLCRELGKDIPRL
jgi:DNA primase